MSGPKVAVIGGGMAGLSAAQALRGLAQVVVHEAGQVVGGKLRTGPLGLDEGAESFLARVPEATGLATELGLPTVHPATSSASVWVGGRLVPLPRGTVMGVPGDLRAAARVLGLVGTARAALDLLLPASLPPADDVAVGPWVRRRVGARVVDRLVDPLLGGVYAGRADLLSLQATVPQLRPALGRRSLVRAAAQLAPAPPAAGTPPAPVFATVHAGMGTLPGATAAASGAEVRTASLVRSIGAVDGGWLVEGERYDAVIVAVPSAPAKRLLAPLVVGGIPEVEYASVALATFVFPDGVVLPPGSGLLVPPSEGRAMKAATFLSQKWAHVPGVVARVSAGRFRDVRDLQRPDTELLGVLAADLAEAAGLRARPVAGSLARWGGALPQYRPGHLARVAALRARLPRGVAVCGAAWDGVGIPACIRSGRAAAAAVLTSLDAAPARALDGY